MLGSKRYDEQPSGYDERHHGPDILIVCSLWPAWYSFSSYFDSVFEACRFIIGSDGAAGQPDGR